MAALSVVVVAKSCQSAEIMGEVPKVCMLKGDRIGATVKACGWENAVGEVVEEAVVVVEKLVKGVSDVLVQLGCKTCKSTYRVS
jgi:copper oxidase (laccase) domain-containing protein